MYTALSPELSDILPSIAGRETKFLRYQRCILGKKSLHHKDERKPQFSRVVCMHHLGQTSVHSWLKVRHTVLAKVGQKLQGGIMCGVSKGSHAVLASPSDPAFHAKPAALHSTALHSTTLYSTVLHCTARNNTAQQCTTRHNTD